MSNFIDLEPQVSVYYGTIPGQERRAGICDALRYLDSHPDQVPGRTITESELSEITRTHESIRDLVNLLGITIVPDSEPTNFEKLTIYLGLHDLDALTNDGVTEFARQLDADGVKAPGESDE